MRMKYNYHTHTRRCGHASGTEREYVETAIREGFQELGFSDHAPYMFPKETGHYSTFRMPVAETEGYVDTVNALKEEYKGDIKIFLGYELEYYPRFFDETYKFIEKFGFDYLILGQHFTNNEIDGVYSYNATDDVTQFRRYTEQVIEAMKTGLFTYVAHPDLFSFTGDSGIYEEEAYKLCEASLKYDIPFEINLLGIGDRRRYPNEKFWSIAGNLGVKTVLGCDAHYPSAIGDLSCVMKAEEIIEKYGVNIIEKPKRFQ